jgi:RNA ligase (TIGR02306 family)
MSTVRTTIERLVNVRPHTNSDNLNLAIVRGWQMVMNDRNAENPRKTGDLVVYFEAGTVLPLKWAEKFEVVNYLSNKTDIEGNKVLVVGKVRLRGEPSFGLTVPVAEALALMDEPDTAVLFEGDDVSHLFGTSKYRPPVKASAGDAEEDHPHFQPYTDIENLRNFPNIIEEGEEVTYREKLHGTNCRVGFVRCDEDPNCIVRMAGSRELRRKAPKTDDEMAANTYWFPWTLESVSLMLSHLGIQGNQSATLYGEVYGGGVQKGFDYGHKRPQFRAFDLSVNGKYLDDPEFEALCQEFGIEVAPLAYRGPHNMAKLKELAEGKTAIEGATHISEGIVVTPTKERVHPQVGRVILKYVSDAYLFRKGGDDDDTTDV